MIECLVPQTQRGQKVWWTHVLFTMHVKGPYAVGNQRMGEIFQVHDKGR